MNNQFEQIYGKSIQTNFWTINLDGIVNLNTDVDKQLEQIYQNFVKKTNFINHFEEKYQHATWN